MSKGQKETRKYSDRIDHYRRYHAAHREQRNAAMRERQARRAYHLRKYGITVEDYDRMLERQGGVCAICGSAEPSSGGNRKIGPNPPRFCVDHDHVTGRVRGLLCDRCNVLIGRAGEDYLLLRAAAKYIWGSEECGANNFTWIPLMGEESS